MRAGLRPAFLVFCLVISLTLVQRYLVQRIKETNGLV